MSALSQKADIFSKRQRGIGRNLRAGGASATAINGDGLNQIALAGDQPAKSLSKGSGWRTIMKTHTFALSPLLATALLGAAIVTPASAAVHPAGLDLQTSNSSNVVKAKQLHRCRQRCEDVVVGRRCAKATGWFNPQTGEGQSTQCQSWDPVTQTLCRRTCTSGGVWFVD